MLSVIKEKISNCCKKLPPFLKSRSLMIGSLIIIVGLSTLIFDYQYNKYLENKDQELIEDYLISKPDDVYIDSDGEIIEYNEGYQHPFIAVIEIPSIKLRGGLVDLKSKANTVNKHIQILSHSDFPDVTNGNFILAAHSGNTRVSYFKNLVKVKNGDLITVYYNDSEYHYKVVKSYNQNKNGTIVIHRDNNKTTLTLTTCNNHNNKKEQLVVIAELIGIDT